MRIIYYIALLFLASCIGIPTDYPEIEYYTLSKIENSGNNNVKIEASVFVESVSIAHEYETVFITELLENNKIEKYHYHRWIQSPDILFKNYLNSYISRSNNFSEFYYSQTSNVIPNYIVKANIIEFEANRELKNVNVVINFVVIKNNSNNSSSVILNKNYSKTIERESSKIKDIPNSLNKALYSSTDEFYNEFINLIK